MELSKELNPTDSQIAMEQLMLVVHHVFVSECALMLQSRVKNKIDMVLTGLHRPVRRRAVGYSAMDRCN